MQPTCLANGLTAYQSPLLDSPALSHGFFTCEGGVSTGLYQSLNCGYGSQDTEENVRENRRRVALALSGDADTPLINGYQVHGSTAVSVTSDWADRPADCDAIVTKTKGLILAVLTADCTPLLFADLKAGVIGAAHAGWKGAKAGIIEATLSAMEQLGATRDNITASIGPLLATESYEVTEEFLTSFLADSPQNTRFFKDGADKDHWQFDLKAYVTDRLTGAGIHQQWCADIDTYQQANAESPKCFSYRRTTHEKLSDYGRQISAIMLR